MANQATIVVKNKGQLVPDKAIERAMEGHTAIGTAFVDDQGELVVQKQAAPFDVDSTKKYFEECKGDAIITIFQKMETPIDEANVQPFVEEEDNEDGSTTTHLAVFIEGDLTSKYALPKQPQSAERQWFEKCFLPLLNEYGGKAKEPSIAGFMDFLRQHEIKMTFEASLGENHGVIKILASTGEILTFAKGDAGFKADWGEVSQGYSEKTFPEQSTTAKKVRSLFSKAKAEGTTPTPPAEEKKDDGKTIIHQPQPDQKTETTIVSLASPPPPEGRVWARPVAQVRKHNKTFKKELERVLGGLPKGWPTMEWFAVRKDALPHRLWEAKEETAISAALEVAKNGGKAEEKLITAEDMRKGLMPPQMQKDLKDKFLPSIAKYTETPNLPTMDELQADENKHPTWFDKTGVHVQDTLGLPASKLEELDRDYHAAYVLRNKAIANMLVKMMHEHPPAKKEEEPEKVQEAPPTTQKKSLFRKSA